MTAIRAEAQSPGSAQGTQANSLVQTIASLNKQISTTNGAGDNALLDQRDTALTSLAQIMDIRVIDNGGGNLNVLVGSAPLVTGSTTRGVSSIQVSYPFTNTHANTQVVFADNKDDQSTSPAGRAGGVDQRARQLSARPRWRPSMYAGLRIDQARSTAFTRRGRVSMDFRMSFSGPRPCWIPRCRSTLPELGPRRALISRLTTARSICTSTDTVTGQVTTKQISVNLSGLWNAHRRWRRWRPSITAGRQECGDRDGRPLDNKLTSPAATAM